LLEHGKEIAVDYAPGTYARGRIPCGSMWTLKKLQLDYNPSEKVTALKTT